MSCRPFVERLLYMYRNADLFFFLDIVYGYSYRNFSYLTLSIGHAAEAYCAHGHSASECPIRRLAVR